MTPALLLASFLTLSCGPELVYSPAPGSTWRTRLTSESASSMSSMRVRMGGLEVPSEYLPTFEIDVTTRAELVAIDTVHAARGGRATRLTRRHEGPTAALTFGFSMEGPASESHAGEGEGSSPLDGRSVTFTWDDPRGKYAAAWSEGENGPDHVPEDAWIDLSLTALLPSDEALEGAVWSVDVESLAVLLEFDEHLPIAFEGEGIDDLLREPDERQGPEGQLEVRLVRLYESDGQELAELAIEGRFQTTERIATDLERVPVAEGPATQVTTIDCEVEGSLVWSRTRGVPLSLELSGETTRAMVTTKDDPPTPAEAYESTTVMTGTARWSLVVEPE